MALVWSNISIEMENNIPEACMDTKANILYKLGCQSEAIELESKVVEHFKKKYKNDPKMYSLYVNGFQKVVDKMKTGKPLELKD